MLAELARTAFYRKVAVKGRRAQKRRALPAARDAVIGARRNAENTIRGLLASFCLRLSLQPRTYDEHVRAALGGSDVLPRIMKGDWAHCRGRVHGLKPCRDRS